MLRIERERLAHALHERSVCEADLALGIGAVYEHAEARNLEPVGWLKEAEDIVRKLGEDLGLCGLRASQTAHSSVTR